MTIWIICFLISVIYCQEYQQMLEHTNHILLPSSLVFLFLCIGLVRFLSLILQTLKLNQKKYIYARSLFANAFQSGVSKKKRRTKKKKSLITSYLTELDELSHMSIEKSLLGPNASEPQFYQPSAAIIQEKTQDNIPDKYYDEQVPACAREFIKLEECLEGLKSLISVASVDSETDDVTVIPTSPSLDLSSVGSSPSISPEPETPATVPVENNNLITIANCNESFVPVETVNLIPTATFVKQRKSKSLKNGQPLPYVPNPGKKKKSAHVALNMIADTVSTPLSWEIHRNEFQTLLDHIQLGKPPGLDFLTKDEKYAGPNATRTLNPQIASVKSAFDFLNQADMKLYQSSSDTNWFHHRALRPSANYVDEKRNSLRSYSLFD
jgi:hypothetical protein